MNNNVDMNMTTKDRIIESALILFAEKGYDGVGVDLIAENAGLRGPSIYKHFKGKEEILNILIEKVEYYYEKNFGSEAHFGKLPSSVEELVEVSFERIMFTLHDDIVQKTRKILSMEQFRNKKIAKLATLHSINSIQGMYEQIFAGMIEAGTIKKNDPHMLAMAFSAPITLLIQKCDREPECEEEIMKSIRDYLEFFAEALRTR